MLANHLYEYITHYDLKTNHGHNYGVQWMQDIAVIYFEQWWRRPITIKCIRHTNTKSKIDYWVTSPEFMALRKRLEEAVSGRAFMEEENEDD